jgi:hypothetical protein
MKNRRWRRSEIREVVLEKVLNPLWARRRELAPGVFSRLGLPPIKPEVVIRDLLHLTLEEPEEIIPEILRDSGSESMVVGVLDRREPRIQVARRRLKAEVRRFTMAHELGHFFLHSHRQYFRDLPVHVGEQNTSGRPREEVEANKFAAEMLIPQGLLRAHWVARYGGVISADEMDENLAFNLTMATGQLVTVGRLLSGRRERSSLFAVDSSRGLPLTQVFGVSQRAMAIRLEELDLVL